MRDRTPVDDSNIWNDYVVLSNQARQLPPGGELVRGLVLWFWLCSKTPGKRLEFVAMRLGIGSPVCSAVDERRISVDSL